MKTLIIHHDDCLRHDPGPNHPEKSERVAAVLRALEGLPGLEFLPAPRATLEQLGRVHDAEYWAWLLALEPAPDSAAERVALDPDTWLSSGSLDAALRGSGAACFAVDQLFGTRAKNAFCVTRPPGHHAESARAMGFCLLNHAAVAARHAQAAHGAQRVAILDFDVHHGNGTQAIFEASPDVLYVSSHQHPLYPGTGLAEEQGCGNVLNLPLPPGAGGVEFRAAWSGKGLPAVEQFAPNLYVSAFLVKDPHLESAEGFMPDRAFGVGSVRVLPEEEFRSADAPTTCLWCDAPATVEAVWAKAY